MPPFNIGKPKRVIVNASTVVGLTGLGQQRAAKAIPNAPLDQIMLQLESGGPQSVSELSNECHIPIQTVEMIIMRHIPILFQEVNAMTAR